MSLRLARLGWVAIALSLGASTVCADDFCASTPTLRVVAKPDVYRATTPTLRIVVKPDTYRATTPTLRIVAKSDTYRATTPTLRIVAKPDTYRATTPTLRIFAKPDTYRATTPTLRIVATVKGADHAETQQPLAAIRRAPHCDVLVTCAASTDILQVEADLASLGFAPETYPGFCRDVAQSLRTCEAAINATASLDALLRQSTEHLTTDPAQGLFLKRCPQLEDYAIALQRRSDAGEDTSIEEAKLTSRISAASIHLLNGRPDLWCKQITSGLP